VSVTPSDSELQAKLAGYYVLISILNVECENYGHTLTA
jgi:hypothetical protein